MSVWAVDPFWSEPTAMQLLSAAHEMLLKKGSDPALGLETMDHVVPFQDSTRVAAVAPCVS